MHQSYGANHRKHPDKPRKTGNLLDPGRWRVEGGALCEVPPSTLHPPRHPRFFRPTLRPATSRADPRCDIQGERIMSLTRFCRPLALPLAVWLLAGHSGPAARADGSSCCSRGVLCPVNIFCISRQPCIIWKCVCAKKACNPCKLPDHGYHFPSWRPWPAPVACNLPPDGWAADQIHTIPEGIPATPPDSLPMPRKAGNPPAR